MMNEIEKQELQGVWKTRGYHTILEIRQDKFIFYDITLVSCFPIEEGSLDEFFARNGRLEKKNEQQILFYPAGAVTCILLDKIDAVPALLDKSLYEDTQTLFEIFWHYFDENYAFFKLRNVDWNLIYKTYRPKVDSQTTKEQLLVIFTEILKALGDSHVGMKAGEVNIQSSTTHFLHQRWVEEFPSEDLLESVLAGIKKLQNGIVENVLDGNAKTAANNRLLWGKIQPNIGYLYITCMFSFIDDENFIAQDNLAVLAAAMDQVLDDLYDTDGLVVDIRFNPGGWDKASFCIADRLTDQKRLAFSKQAVWENGLTETQPIYTQPEGKKQYTKPIVLLTSKTTVSAAEIFTLCTMAMPHITRMGESTHGVLSDILGKKFPNGWELGISNEIYTASDGKSYEGIGIPPHIEARVFDQEHLYENFYALVKKAAAYLTR